MPEIKAFPFDLLKGFGLSYVTIRLCFLTAACGLMGTVVKTEILTFPPLYSTRLPARNNYMLITRSCNVHDTAHCLVGWKSAHFLSGNTIL